MESARNHYFPVFPWILDLLSWKKSALIRFDILRLFVNTLTADNKYSRCIMQKFPLQVRTALSQKENTFCSFFFAFLKFELNFQHFETKDEYPSLIISKIIDSERGGYLNVWKVLLKNTIR